MKNKIVHFTDVHLGNPRLSPNELYTDMVTYLYPQIKESKLTVSGGDMFDQLLRLDNTSSLVAMKIAHDFRTMSKENNVKIRLLRGTFTHDRVQNKIFDCIDDPLADIKCIDTVSIEKIQDLDLSILYIPDNLPYKNKVMCLEYIKELLTINDLQKIDFVIGHGYFEHVLPKGMTHAPHCMFSVEDFESIVKHYVLMGHVHTRASYKNVIYTGSFNRLAHAEEEAKGFTILEETKDKWVPKFIENKDAILFYTIELQGTNIDNLTNQIDAFIIQKYGSNPYGYLRIKHVSLEIRQILASVINNKYPTLSITHKDIKEEESPSLLEDREFEIYEFIQPTNNSIPKLIYDFVVEKKGVCGVDINTISLKLGLEV